MSSELDDGRTGLRSLVPDALVPDSVLEARLTLAVVLLALGLLAGLVAAVASLAAPPEAAAQPRQADFSIGEIMSAPLPTGMTASPDGETVAWVQNAEGVRNVWVAAAPDWEARRLTDYGGDDGWPIGDLTFTPDGSRLLYVRGGNPNASGWIANPTSDPEARSRDIWVVDVSAEAPAEPRKLAEGSGPAVDPAGGRVAFRRDGDIWFVGLGEGAEPEAAVEDRGGAGDLAWSPDGSWLAFTSGREEHSLIGLYDPVADTLDYKSPSVDDDFGPTWSPDGTRLAWVRTASEPKDLPFTPERTVAEPWSIQLFDLESGEARELWSADGGYGSAFQGAGGGPLWWTDGDRLVFPWEESGWVHLYSVPASGGEAVALTPGDGFVEEAALARDGRTMIYATNQGDIDRRHLHRVPAAGDASPEPITTGEGIEWSPTPLAGGGLALMASGARDPAHAEVMPASGGGPGERRWLAPGTLPDRFPGDELVEPRQVVFPAADGMPIHGQLFLPPDVEPGEAAGRPAVIFTHGGSRRQMLLGWHYLGYYHRAYAMNQWLASKGYVVLSVNYRSGIGYGLEFREAEDYGAAGGSEYADMEGGGLYLAGRPEVDGDRIGLWGGSYGGYMTAMGLARGSDLFAAGVDFHGAHNWNVIIENFVPDYEPARRPEFRERAYEASPIADADEWRSPVLFVHGDDDRNVPFTETIRLIAELRRHGKAHVEQLVFPDEVHGFLLHENWLRAYSAAGDFFDRMIGSPDD